MKKYIPILLVGTLMVVLQSRIMGQSVLYYYHSNKIEIPCKKDCFNVYFDRVSCPIDTIMAQFSVIGQIQEADSFNYVCVVNYSGGTLQQSVAALWKVKGVSGVEYIIGDDDVSVPSTNLFYVQLHNAEDYPFLVNFADSAGARILEDLDRNWIVLQNTNKDRTSIETANLFWETGQFQNIDYGFALKYQLNDNGCVSDASFDQQWNMDAINACTAWSTTTGNSNVKVAIIDDGVFEGHEEFSNCNVAYSYHANYSSSPAQVIANWNLSTHTYESHGTHVGGIIFSGHNNYEIAGVAPGASLINISRVWTGGADHNYYLAKGINKAVSQGAVIMNNSWSDQGGYGIYQLLHSTIIEEALDSAIANGVLLVCAAGNHNGSVDFPASYRDEIMAVGSIDADYTRSDFSCYGQELDIMAPGDDILSTTYFPDPNDPYYNHYWTLSGTSQAAPHVSGVAALMLSVNPNLTASQIARLIKGTAQKVGNYTYTYAANSHLNGSWNIEMGHGLVDAGAAVQAASAEILHQLYIKDNATDYGIEPNCYQYDVNKSPDIWFTDMNDNTVSSLMRGNQYKVKVRIRNKSNWMFLFNTNKLTLKWALGSSLQWVNNFNPPCTTCDCVAGGNVSIPSSTIIIPAGGSKVVSANFTAPEYTSSGFNVCPMTGNVLNFNMVAYVNDGGLTIGVNETTCPLEHFVRANNNVAWTSCPLYLTLEPIIYSINPNPTGTQTAISYTLGGERNANLIITGPNGSIISSVPAFDSATKYIDVQSLPAGRYEVRLEARGVVFDSKPLIISH